MEPYFYEFKTHAKARWVGRTVLDVFCKEFSAQTREYYVCVSIFYYAHYELYCVFVFLFASCHCTLYLIMCTPFIIIAIIINSLTSLHSLLHITNQTFLL